MSEVTGPIVATALVLCAVFVPTAFISGLTGQFYNNCHHYCDFYGHIGFQLTYSLAALCAVLLKDHHAPKDSFARLMDVALGWFFRPFNRVFAWSAQNTPRASAL